MRLSVSTKAGSQTRYILLGDSFAEGYGVNFEDTAQAQLEKLLGIDVYNFGSAGYFGPVQYYLIYKDLRADISTTGSFCFSFRQMTSRTTTFSVWKDLRPTWYRPYYKKNNSGPVRHIFIQIGQFRAEHSKMIREITKTMMILTGVSSGDFCVTIRLPLIRCVQSNILSLQTQSKSLGIAATMMQRRSSKRLRSISLKRLSADATPRRVTILVIPNREDIERIRSGASYKDNIGLRNCRH